MISVLGLELNEAAERLMQAGYEVEKVFVRSRKGQDGDSLRVIKQEQTGEGRMKLLYSSFITNIRTDN